MNHAITEPLSNLSEDIKKRYRLLKERQPMIRARNAATELGISEGELLASRVGDGVIRLTDDAEAVLKAVSPVGEVMALTRNESCVHERKGVYDNSEFFQHGRMAMGLFVNPDIDLRLFMNHWRFVFAAVEQTRGGLRNSLQFFDKSGQALHKIYLTPKSDESRYHELVSVHSHRLQEPVIEVEAYKPPQAERPDSEIDWDGLRAAYENLKDTHDFHPMLMKFKAGREQCFRRIGSDFAYRTANDAARRVLQAVRDRQCEMMVFVGNRGCIQIHTGPVKKLVESGPWYNVLDPKFNLHLREDHIARTWVTRKPTEDGIVTALEMFDEGGGIIATFFGRRKPGMPELELWREIIADIPAMEGAGA